MSTRNALITGASQGLGRALFTELAHQGWRVVGVARSADRLHGIVQAARDEGFEAWGITADVSDAAATLALHAAELAGPIDLVVHCASTLGPVPLRPLLQIDDQAFDRVLQVNLAGPFRLTRHVVGSMALRGGGTVAFISSDAALEAYPTWGAYGATKAAADHLVRTFAAEVPEVRFLSFDPGEMDTAMHEAAMPEADKSTLRRPEDVAKAIIGHLDAPTGTRLEVTP